MDLFIDEAHTALCIFPVFFPCMLLLRFTAFFYNGRTDLLTLAISRAAFASKKILEYDDQTIKGLEIWIQILLMGFCHDQLTSFLCQRAFVA